MLKLEYLEFTPSPNKEARTAKPQWIVLHCPSGTFQSAINTFKNPKNKVSAHYVVSKAGEIVCMVKPDLKAWHTLEFNNVSLGIEMEDGDAKDSKKNCKTDPTWCTDKQREAVAELVATLMLKYNIPLEKVIGHNEPFLQKPPYNNNHTDPEKHWDWQKFRPLVKKHLEKGNG